MVAALLTVAVILVLTVGLPILSFRRASAARADVERLERRIAILEDAGREGRSGPRSQTEAPTPSGLDRATETTRSAPRAPLAPLARSETPQAPDVTQSAPADRTQLALARLEGRIGTQWMLYVGVATLVIGLGLLSG